MPKFHLPSLNALRAFEAAARHQSIKKACAELDVNHASVSRQIMRLEGYVGHDLFERSYRKVRLNDDGEFLLKAVSTGFSQIQRALTRLRRGAHPDSLVISVDPDFAGLWLVPRLAEFYAIVPDSLVEILAEKAAPSLLDPRRSCGIQYAEAGLKLENAEPLFRAHLFPVCAKRLAQSGRLGSLDDLRRHVLLHDRSTDEWAQFLRSHSAPANIKVGSGVIFSDTAHCLDAAVRGQGVAIGDNFLAAAHLSEGRLIRPFGSAVRSKNTYYFIAPASALRHPAVSAFRTWLLQSIKRQRKDRRVN